MAVGVAPNEEDNPELQLAFRRLDQIATERFLSGHRPSANNIETLERILADIGELMELTDKQTDYLKEYLLTAITSGGLPYIRPSLILTLLADERLPYGEERNGTRVSINRDTAMDGIVKAEPNDIAKTLLTYLYDRGEADYRSDLDLYSQFIDSPDVHETDLANLNHHIKDAAVGHCAKCVNLIEALPDLGIVRPSVFAVLPRTADGEIPVIADFEAATEALVQADAVHPPESLVTQACVHASATMFVRWVIQDIYGTDFPAEIHY